MGKLRIDPEDLLDAVMKVMKENRKQRFVDRYGDNSLVLFSAALFSGLFTVIGFFLAFSNENQNCWWAAGFFGAFFIAMVLSLNHSQNKAMQRSWDDWLEGPMNNGLGKMLSDMGLSNRRELALAREAMNLQLFNEKPRKATSRDTQLWGKTTSPTTLLTWSWVRLALTSLCA